MELLDTNYLEDNIVKFTKRDKNIDINYVERNKKELTALCNVINIFGLVPTSNSKIEEKTLEELYEKFPDLTNKKALL